MYNKNVNMHVVSSKIWIVYLLSTYASMSIFSMTCFFILYMHHILGLRCIYYWLDWYHNYLNNVIKRRYNLHPNLYMKFDHSIDLLKRQLEAIWFNQLYVYANICIVFVLSFLSNMIILSTHDSIDFILSIVIHKILSRMIFLIICVLLSYLIIWVSIYLIIKLSNRYLHKHFIWLSNILWTIFVINSYNYQDIYRQSMNKYHKLTNRSIQWLNQYIRTWYMTIFNFSIMNNFSYLTIIQELYMILLIAISYHNILLILSIQLCMILLYLIIMFMNIIYLFGFIKKKYFLYLYYCLLFQIFILFLVYQYTLYLYNYHVFNDVRAHIFIQFLEVLHIYEHFNLYYLTNTFYNDIIWYIDDMYNIWCIFFCKETSFNHIYSIKIWNLIVNHVRKNNIFFTNGYNILIGDNATGKTMLSYLIKYKQNLRYASAQIYMNGIWIISHKSTTIKYSNIFSCKKIFIFYQFKHSDDLLKDIDFKRLWSILMWFESLTEDEKAKFYTLIYNKYVHLKSCNLEYLCGLERQCFKLVTLLLTIKSYDIIILDEFKNHLTNTYIQLFQKILFNLSSLYRDKLFIDMKHNLDNIVLWKNINVQILWNYQESDTLLSMKEHNKLKGI